MAITYTWSFPTLDVVYHEGMMQNVVQVAHWVYTAVDGDYTASFCDTVSLAPPSVESFIPYDDLTEAEVQSWVEQALGEETIASMQFNLAGQIESQKNPKGGPLPPPWAVTV